MEKYSNLPKDNSEKAMNLSTEQKENKELAEKLFPEELPSIKSLFEKYPKRELPKDAMVTRIAPSPTGFMHIGGIYMALISKRFADQTKGVYYLRIEDTDKKREVEGARKVIAESLHRFGLDPEEGEGTDGIERGKYGPYRQSERKDIYKSFIKYLIEIGRAYPCFSSEEELEKMRKMQEELKVRPGYYGVWAKYRDLDKKTTGEMLEQNKPFVIRFKSMGNNVNTFIHNDLIKGSVEMPENDLDAIIMKSDGLPTYHLAHAVDDRLMGTTHVLRGDEWLSSVPLHYELFQALGFEHPEYSHIAPINKIDESGGKRKLSKRKDPEANVAFYEESGYPEIAVTEYLLNIANPDFEDWRKNNPDKSPLGFKLFFNKLSTGAGPIFDKTKLQNIAKEVIAKMKPEEFYKNVFDWALKHDLEFGEILAKDPEYWLRVFSIERGGNKPRKDIAMWSEVKEVFSFFNKEHFTKPDWSNFTSVLSSSEIKDIISQYSEIFSSADSPEKWLEKVKKIAANFGFAPNTRTFKENRNNYRGHIGEIAQVIRFAITGQTQSPDLYQTVQALGEEECKKRLAF